MLYAQPEKKIVKVIKVNLDECIGCRSCEVACSAYHAKPKYSSVNPSRSRIRVVMDLINKGYVPIRAAGYTKAECTNRNVYVIYGKEYSECSFCGVSCLSRDIFREPDSGFPLKCDMCEDNTSGPVCVQVCGTQALAYVEYEVEAKEEEQLKVSDLDVELRSLVNKYGLRDLEDGIARIAQEG